MKKTLIFILFIFFMISCRDSESDKMEEKLENAISEIESLKNKRKEDSISEISVRSDLMDSIRNNGSLDLSTMYEKLKSSIFVVYTTDDYDLFQGTAFLVDNQGTCISNYHIFKNTTKAILENNNGIRYSIDEILKYDINNDYIIFKININDDFINPLRISNTIAMVGEECFTIGNPKGLNQTLSKGIVSGYRDFNKLIQTTTEITHGSSGGPLFNKKGEVIGITTSGLGEANLNFAVNIKEIPLINNYHTDANEYFTVINDRAYFHDYPSNEMRRNAYLIKGENGNVIESRNGFVYIIFKNTKNQITKGWININDVSFK
jgi:hypothetical protein